MYPSLVTDGFADREARSSRASEIMLGKPAETYYSPSAFDQGYLNHVGIRPPISAPASTMGDTDYDMASVERTTDSARVYAFMRLDYLT